VPTPLPPSQSTAPSAQARDPLGSSAQWRFALGLTLAALAAGGFAVLFRSSLAWVSWRTTGAFDVVGAMRSLPVWLRIALPALGGLCAGAISVFAARFGSNQGVGDVMEAVALGRTALSIRVTLLKSLASWCAITSGGSIGREGPLIQFGGAAAQFLSKRLALGATRTRRLIAAGVAAGFAAAYNTPFSAVLFVLEVVTGVVVLDAILPALIATTIATVLTRASAGEGPIYGQRVFVLHSALELFAFAGLAVTAALVALGFMQLLSYAEARFRRLPWPLPLRAGLGGLATGLLLAGLPAVAGNGYEPLNLLLDGELGPEFVFFLLCGKIAATVCTVASGSPGGVFTPTLLIGGATGFLYGAILSHVAQLGSLGGYALVGMAAATAACTHAPLMAAVMVFELSGDYAIVLPLVLSTALATLVSRRMRRESIYAAELKQRGIAWELTFEGRRVIRH